eukprot:2332931-Rhodomonas_salina.1
MSDLSPAMPSMCAIWPPGSCNHVSLHSDLSLKLAYPGYPGTRVPGFLFGDKLHRRVPGYGSFQNYYEEEFLPSR